MGGDEIQDARYRGRIQTDYVGLYASTAAGDRVALPSRTLPGRCPGPVTPEAL